MIELLKSRYTAIAAFIAVNAFNVWLTAYHSTNAAEWVGGAVMTLGSLSLLLGKSILTWKDDVQ